MRIASKQRGLAMIEIMATVLIVTIGVSGMGLLLLRAIQSTQDNAQYSQAMWIVEDYVGRMRANPEGARNSFYELNPENIDCSVPPDDLCAETFQLGVEVAADNCSYTRNDADTGNEMAEFDNWISTCSLNPDIYDGPSDFVVNPTLTSNCTVNILNNAGNTICTQYLVSLTWQTRLDKVSSDADERIQENEYSMVVGVN